MRALVACALACVLLGAAPSPEAAPSPAPSPAAPHASVGGRYYTVVTPQAHWNAGSGDFTATGRVKLTQPGMIAYADRAVGNTKTGDATLTGNVEVHDSGLNGGTISKSAREPGVLTCDELDINGKLDAYRALGHAHYVSLDRTATADSMILDRKHHKLYLNGSVALQQQGSTLAGDRVDVNLRTGQTDENGAPLIITAPYATPVPKPSAPSLEAPPSAPSAPSATSPTLAPLVLPAPSPLPSPAPSRSPGH
jgi:lipopolysaccharide assembly outer membrane protein LptD (OstA)